MGRGAILPPLGRHCLCVPVFCGSLGVLPEHRVQTSPSCTGNGPPSNGT